MIISRKHNFGFIHNPKCAGSAVRDHIAEFDDANGAFSEVKDHEQLGRVHLKHLTLSDLEKYFPEYFDVVTKVDSFVLVREPMQRFISGVSQYVRSTTNWKKTIFDLSHDEVNDVLRHVLERIAQGGVSRDPLLCIFTRQKEFIETKDRRIIDKIVAVDYISELLTEFSRRTGKVYDATHVSNATRRVRFVKSQGGIAAVTRFGRAFLPEKLYHSARRLAAPWLFQRESSMLAIAAFESDHVRSAVIEYYKEDFGIYKRSLARSGPGNSATSMMYKETPPLHSPGRDGRI